MFDDQSAFQERFEWGEAGVQRLAGHADIVVVVDVLSFSTAVDVAVGRGAIVYPARWRDGRATDLATRVGALLAGGRTSGETDVSHSPYSLSPTSLQTIPAGTRLVLPSPNGATLTLRAAASGATVLVGCLRNATAVGSACRSYGGSVAVISAGERWVDAGDQTGSLRPAIEDLIGAGAILSALIPVRPSPEALIAMSAFQAAASDLDRFLASCSSGQELRDRGFLEDVTIAAQLNSSQAVPMLRGESIERWTSADPVTEGKPSRG